MVNIVPLYCAVITEIPIVSSEVIGRQTTDCRPTGVSGSSSSQLPNNGPLELFQLPHHNKGARYYQTSVIQQHDSNESSSPCEIVFFTFLQKPYFRQSDLKVWLRKFIEMAEAHSSSQKELKIGSCGGIRRYGVWWNYHLYVFRYD